MLHVAVRGNFGMFRSSSWGCGVPGSGVRGLGIGVIRSLGFGLWV